MKINVWHWIELNLITIQNGALREMLKDDPNDQDARAKLEACQHDFRELLEKIDRENQTRTL